VNQDATPDPSATPPGRPAGYRHVLNNASFRALWLAQNVSLFGDILYTVGLMFHVQQQTGSALQTTGVLVAEALPRFLLGPVAGVLVDRWDRKRVLVVADLARAALVGLLAALLLSRGLTLAATYAIMTALSTATTFFGPARLAFLPQVVDRDELVLANSLDAASQQVVQVLGWALGGTLAVWLGLIGVALIDVATFAVSATLLLAARGREVPPSPSEARPTMRSQLGEGWHELRANPIVRTITAMDLAEMAANSVWTPALMIVFTQRALRASAQIWGLQNALFYAGAMLGAALAAVIARRLAANAGRLLLLSAAWSGLLTFIYAFNRNLPFNLFLCLIYGPPYQMRDLMQQSLLQTRMRQGVMGRVFALREVLLWLVYLVSAPAMGALADAVPVQWAYALAGGLYWLAASFGLLAPRLRRATLPSGGRAAEDVV
jgi:DHA3 family macrolide efflux protein-like MFS transporter